MTITPPVLQGSGLILLGGGLILGTIATDPMQGLMFSSRLAIVLGFVVASLGLLQQNVGKPPQQSGERQGSISEE
jgi:hypothetical protein